MLRTSGWCSTATEVGLARTRQDLTHIVPSAFAFYGSSTNVTNLQFKSHIFYISRVHILLIVMYDTDGIKWP